MTNTTIVAGMKVTDLVTGVSFEVTAANDNVKLINLFDVFFIIHPITPPIVVPIVPKNNPRIVVFIMFSIICILSFIKIYIVLNFDIKKTPF